MVVANFRRKSLKIQDLGEIWGYGNKRQFSVIWDIFNTKLTQRPCLGWRGFYIEFIQVYVPERAFVGCGVAGDERNGKVPTRMDPLVEELLKMCF